jgi:hypothetical protein
MVRRVSMSRTSDVNRRRFLAVAGGVAASSFVVGKDSPSSPVPLTVADYPVTIDITDPSAIKYSTPNQSDASVVKNVAVGKTFSWTVIPPNMFRLTIFFLRKTPFADANGPVYAFTGSESAASQGKIGGIIAGPNGDYRYYVAVFDDEKGRTYTYDPKIIVGTGHDDAKAEIVMAQDDLKAAEPKLSDKPEIQKQIGSIVKTLGGIIDQLK